MIIKVDPGAKYIFTTDKVLRTEQAEKIRKDLSAFGVDAIVVDRMSNADIRIFCEKPSHSYSYEQIIARALIFVSLFLLGFLLAKEFWI